MIDDSVYKSAFAKGSPGRLVLLDLIQKYHVLTGSEQTWVMDGLSRVQEGQRSVVIDILNRVFSREETLDILAESSTGRPNTKAPTTPMDKG